MTIASLKYLVRKQNLKSSEENIEKETQKPLWFEINKKEFEELTGDVYNNQDSNSFKIS